MHVSAAISELRDSNQNKKEKEKEKNTVELPNRGHFGTAVFVLSLEVVLFSEVV